METMHSQSERMFDLREKASGTQQAKILQVEGDKPSETDHFRQGVQTKATKNE